MKKRNLYPCSFFVLPKEWIEKNQETIQPNKNDMDNTNKTPIIIE